MSAVLVQATGKQEKVATTVSPETFNASGAFVPGNVVILALSYSSAVDVTVTIAGTVATKVAGNTFAANGVISAIFAATIVNGSRTDVVIASNTSSHYYTFSAEEWSGISLPADKTNTGTGNNTAPTAGSTGTMTVNDEVIYSVFMLNGADQTSITGPSGYTKVWEELTASTIVGGSAAYKITAVGGAENPTWGLSAGDVWAATVATFPVVGGSVTPTTGMRIQHARHPGRSPGKGLASGRFIQRPGATSATGLGGGGGGALGNQNLSVQSTPDEGGGTLLTAFKQNGSAAIGGHGMDRNNTGVDVVVTFNSQVSGSTFIIDLTTVYGTPSFFTISDNKGNTYSEIVRADNFYPTYSLVRLVCFNGVGGTGHQFTVSNNHGFEMCIYVTEITNCTALAGTSGATNSSNSGLNGTSTGPTDSGNVNVTDSAAVMHGAHSGNGLTFSYTFVGNPGYTQLDTEPGPNQAQGASFYKLLDNGGGGSTPISGADTGSAAEAAAVMAILSASDTGSAAEATTLDSFTTQADTGTASESTAVMAGFSSADTGAGAEAAAVAAIFSSADTASAAEATTVQAGVTGADTGTAAEATTTQASLTGADTASAAEATATLAGLTSADTASAAEATAVQAGLSAADTGAGAEGQAVVVLTLISAADTATATEGQAVVVLTLVSAADTATAAEATAIQAGLTASDTASAAEGTLSALFSTVADTAAAVESQSLLAAFSAADTGSATEAQAIAVPLSAGDTASGVSAASVQAVVTAADTASAAEAQALAAFTTVQDSATATSSAAVLVTITAADFGTMFESAQVVQPNFGLPRIVSPGLRGSPAHPKLIGRVVKPTLTGVA